MQDLKPVPPRQYDVEDDEIESVGVGVEKSLLTRSRHSDPIALFFKTFLECTRNLRFVFYNQDVHNAASFRIVSRYRDESSLSIPDRILSAEFRNL